jgi:ADP-heptose:LPS heptosyltransferase
VKGAEVHFLTKKEFLPLLSENPYINKIHTLDGNMHALLQSLKVEQFDYIIDLHRNLRSQRVKSSLKIMSFTLDKINLAKFLMIRFKINRLPDKHIVDRYLETLRLFDVANDGEGLDHFIPDRDEVPVSSLPASHRNGFVAMVVGAMHGTKQMPVGKLVTICRELDLPVILLGGKRETAIGREIDSQTGELVLNACGQYKINQSASLIRQSRVVITHDTGLMHIAAAFRKKILSVWGHTIPAFGMYPYMPDKASRIFEVVGLPCRPCTKIGKEKCPKGHFRCMNEIDYPDIIRTAKRLF